MFFHYRQEPDPTSIEELIAHKVHGPALINPLSHWPLYAPLAGYVPPGLLGPEHQTLLAIQLVDPLVVHCPPLPLQEAVETPVAIAYTVLSQVSEPDP